MLLFTLLSFSQWPMSALMVTWGWMMGHHPTMAELTCVSTNSGEASVITTGMAKMPGLSAANSPTQPLVCHSSSLRLVAHHFTLISVHSITPTAASAVTGSYFPQASSNIVASNFACTGSESLLTDCSYTMSGDCSHQEEAGVFCSEPCTPTGSIRLVDGPDAYGGRVEVCMGGVWGTVCQGFWSLEDATVACRQLGYSEIGMHKRTIKSSSFH